MEAKIIYDTKDEITKKITNLNVRRNVLIVFSNYISTLENIYNVIKDNNEKSADMYLQSAINAFNRRLELFIKSDGYPYEKVQFIKDNKAKYNKSTIQSDELVYLYNKIMFGDFDFEFYYEILMYPNKNYNTICADLNHLMSHLGYKREKKIYKDANVDMQKYKSLCNAINNVE